jgi:hypothetical protein
LQAGASLAARLRLLALTAAAHARSHRRAQQAGLVARDMRWNPDWQPPWELRRTSPRPGPTERWQALDRAFDGWLATVDDSDRDLPRWADAYEGLAAAARKLADALEHASQQELAVCSFCAKRSTEVHKIIRGPGVFICDECVRLSAEILEQEG